MLRDVVQMYIFLPSDVPIRCSQREHDRSCCNFHYDCERAASRTARYGVFDIRYPYSHARIVPSKYAFRIGPKKW